MATKLESLSTKLQSALDLANSLPDAITLDELTNPGSAATMLEGTEMLDAQGKKVTGAIESKDSSDLTISGPFFTVPAGYYPEDSKATMADAVFGDTTLTINDSGLVYARPNIESDGYISNENSIVVPTTKQLDTQPATTITPTKSSQTAVAKNVYTTGAVTVAPIPAQYITTTDATAVSDDIVTGETAYVNGVKLTGTNPYEKVATDTEVTAQATQIEEIMGLLEGKSVPGGGASIDTCSIRLINNDGSISGYSYLSYRDGQFVPVTYNNYPQYNNIDVTLTDVICGGYIYVQTRILDTMTGIEIAGEATTERTLILGTAYATVNIYAPSIAGSSSTVTIIDND